MWLNMSGSHAQWVKYALTFQGGGILSQLFSFHPKKAIHPGAGYEGLSEYKSVVYYQVKQPCWYETVKVSIRCLSLLPPVGPHLYACLRFTPLSFWSYPQSSRWAEWIGSCNSVSEHPSFINTALFTGILIQEWTEIWTEKCNSWNEEVTYHSDAKPNQRTFHSPQLPTVLFSWPLPESSGLLFSLKVFYRFWRVSQIKHIPWAHVAPHATKEQRLLTPLSDSDRVSKARHPRS